MCYHHPQQVTTYLHAALEWLIWSTRRIPGGTGWLLGCSWQEPSPHVHTHRPADYELRSQLVCKGLGVSYCQITECIRTHCRHFEPFIATHCKSAFLQPLPKGNKQQHSGWTDCLLIIQNFFSITSDWIYFKRLNNKAKISKIQWNFICCPVPVIPVQPFADSLTKTLMRWRHVCEGSRL